MEYRIKAKMKTVVERKKNLINNKHFSVHVFKSQLRIDSVTHVKCKIPCGISNIQMALANMIWDS